VRYTLFVGGFLSTLVCGPSGEVRTARAKAPTGEPAAGAAPSSASAMTAEKRRALDDLKRQDLATALALRGVSLKWQDYDLTQLADWRDRIDAAYALHAQHGVDVDWRVTSLPVLSDMRVRAAKASELASAYGITVDWRLYAWGDLERLRLSAARASRGTPSTLTAGDRLAPFGSVGPARRLGTRPRDPDAIIEPTFAFDSPSVWARPFGRQAKEDPDAILVPAFVTAPSPPEDGALERDDLIDPWHPPGAAPGVESE
jgi:hypothetical protein